MTSFTPSPFDDKSRINGTDWKNIIMFVVLSVVLAWLFDHYIMAPRQQAVQAYKQQQAAAQLQQAPGEEEKILPVKEALAHAPRTTLENENVELSIPLRGNRIDDLSLRRYFTTLGGNERIRMLSPAATEETHYAEMGWVGENKALTLPDESTLWTKEKSTNPQEVLLAWTSPQGLKFTRTVTVDKHFMLTLTQGVENKGDKEIRLWPYALISQHGVPKGLSGGIVYEGGIGYIGGNLNEYDYGDIKGLESGRQSFAAAAGWIGFTNRYFFTGLIPDQKEEMTYSFAYQKAPGEQGRDRYQVDLQGQPRILKAGEKASFDLHLFAGAKQTRLLNAYEKNLGVAHFDLVVDYGWFYFLTKPFYYALTYINDYVGNFGVAILLLTILLRAAVFPLANTSFRSFAKMKIIGPKVQELQKQYANDRQKMQEELVKLYEREKVNPMSGCLPILAQIPIFFAMYKVINVAIEMRHAPFFGWIQDLSAPDPTSVFNLFGLLPYDVPGILHIGVWPMLMFAMMMIQVRLSPPPPDNMMKVFFLYYYPITLAFVMSHFAAGLVIYWAFSSFLSVIQQMAIMHSYGSEIHLISRFQKKKAPAPGEVLESTAQEVEEPEPSPSGPDFTHLSIKKKKKKG